MRFILPVLAAALMVGSLAHANELDNEAQVTNETKALSKDLPQTLVVRTNEQTGEVQVLHTSARLPADITASASLAKAHFVKADLSKPAGELDRDSSQSSWYFCWNRGFGGYGYNPYYGYGGYNFYYNPYYSYSYYGWNYGYYRWNWGWY